jgi:glutathione S-transferase
MKPQLISIPYSPWSERARWALQARGVDFANRTYQPLLGEPELRWRLAKWTGPVSVPVLLTDAGAIADSFAIAQYAVQHGSGPELFPPGAEAAVAEWNALSERGLDAGRSLSLARVLLNSDALLEMMPRSLRGLPGAAQIAAAGVKRTLRKYGAAPQGNLETLTDVLDRLREGLARSASTSQPRTLLADFSYADITMAQVLAFVRPPEKGLKIGRANRAAFADNDLAARYSDLLAWRDALYASHRGAL